MFNSPLNFIVQTRAKIRKGTNTLNAASYLSNQFIKLFYRNFKFVVFFVNKYDIFFNFFSINFKKII